MPIVSPRSTSLRITLILLATLHLPPALHAQRRGFTIPPWAKGRLFWVSSASPMLTHMRQRPAFTAAAHTLGSYITHVENEITSSLRNATPPERTQLFHLCNFVNRNFGGSIDAHMGIHGLPALTPDCITDVIGTRLYADRTPSFSLHTIIAAVAAVKDEVDRERMFLFNTILRTWKSFPAVQFSWSRPVVNKFYPWERANRRCKLTGVALLRLNQNWYFEIVITNAPPTHTPEHWHRQSLHEYVHVADPLGTRAHALLQRVPLYHGAASDKGELVSSVDNATTTFSRGQGPSLPSKFYSTYPEQNPAMIEAMEASDRSFRQAVDALSASSMCILFLPLVLNVVPVALITHVGTRVLLTYMLLSDMLTVVPLLFKGGELIVTGMSRFRAVGTRLENTMSGLKGAVAAGQIWTAECRSRDETPVLGFVFVAVAVVALAGGIWLEIWARRFVARRARRKAEKLAVYMRIGADEAYETYDLSKGADGLPAKKGRGGDSVMASRLGRAFASPPFPQDPKSTPNLPPPASV